MGPSVDRDNDGPGPHGGIAKSIRCRPCERRDLRVSARRSSRSPCSLVFTPSQLALHIIAFGGYGSLRSQGRRRRGTRCSLVLTPWQLVLHTIDFGGYGSLRTQGPPRERV